MATWQHLRSSTANKRPTTSLADGRIAINTNTASPGLFFKDSAGTGIVKVGPVHVGTTAPNSSPAVGGSTGNYLGEQWLDTSVSPAQMKVWNGSTWVGVVADELPVSKLQDGEPRQLIQTDAAGTGVEWTSNIDIPGTLDVTSTATFDSIASHPLGSAAAPTITFTGDTNTGVYSPGADQVAISTGGSGRLFVDASGNVEVRTGNLTLGAVGGEGGQLNINNTTNTGSVYILDASTDTNARLFTTNNNCNLQIGQLVGTGGNIQLFTGGSERCRIDSSGRLLVGTSSQLTSVGALKQEIVNGSLAISSFLGNAFAYGLPFTKSRGSSIGTIVQNGDELGNVDWYGDDGTGTAKLAARLQAYVDGTPGANDMPGRLVFSTTADGASSPTERMRITNGGALKVTTTGSNRDSTSLAHELINNVANNHTLAIQQNSTAYTEAAGGMLLLNCATSASSSWFFGGWYSGNIGDREFTFRGDGNGLCDGAWTGGGADYAEYFEWSDSNPNAEDRRGTSVVLDGDKIREAVAGEDPIGVISGNPSVVGDAAWNKWNGKYLRDEFGTYILEDYEVEDEDGNTVIQQRRKLNPAYDPDVEYISREERPEWDCVGLMGKLRIRKGQVTGPRWIKMRDISDSVEEWLVR